MKKTPYSVRLEPKQVELAKKMGVDIADLFRKTLDMVLRQKICSTCGADLKNKK